MNTLCGSPLAAFPLTRSMFDGAEHTLVELEGIRVAAFRFGSGVEAVRITTERVELVMLPFRGQQLWRYCVDGEELTMLTHFDEPARSTVFGQTYGGFLIHCGLTGIGQPAPEDSHDQHGELPNADFDSATLLVGQDADGPWLGVTGQVSLKATHRMDVLFEPRVVVHSAHTRLDVDVRITNRRRTPFGYSYLCHINWPIFDGARLVQSARLDRDHFELAPAAGQDGPTQAYTATIEAHPQASTTLSLSQPVVPEYCAILRPETDADGWAHFLMSRPDGRAAAVSYETEHLPLAIRWVSNTGDECCSGFCLPTTSHHRGRAAAERDGLIREVAPGQTVAMRMQLDLLSAEQATAREAHITAMLAR